MLLALTTIAAAQSVPASETTIQQPGSGQAAFDVQGNAYFFGGPVTAGAAQTQPGGGTCSEATGFIGDIPAPCPDVSVIKVDPSGKELWGTLLGGQTADTGTALVIDSSGNILLTGATGGQFPTTPGAAIVSSITATVFAAKISADGSKIIYSTYLPASLAVSSSIAVDAAGNAYISGKTSSGHAFVLKLSPDGATILYLVTLGGGGADAGTAIAVDPAGNAVVAGQTTSPDFPVTAGAFQPQLQGTQNAFVVRLDPAGEVLTSTYLGGSAADSPSSIALDGAGNIDLAGSTSSLDFPTTQGTFQPTPIVPAWNNSSPAGFVAQISSNGTSLNWATYVMSSDLPGEPTVPFEVGVGAMAVTSGGDIYLGGVTGPGFPVTTSAPNICFLGNAKRTNGFLAHLSSNGALLDATYLGSSTGDDTFFVGGILPRSGQPVLVAWHGDGQPSTASVSQLTFGDQGWMASPCLSTDVLNAATLSGTYGIAPGELVTLTGFGIGPEVGAAYRPDSQGNVPAQLAGTQVLFDGTPAPVLYAQSRQINAIAPAGITVGGTTAITVIYNNQAFGPVVAPVTFGSPGIFRAQVGLSAQAVARNQDWTINGPSNPAARGSIVTVWGTGYGETSPPCTPGGLNAPQAEPLLVGVTALIFDGKIESAEYAGSAPTLLCGVVQINFQVPVEIPPGGFSFEPWIRQRLGNGMTTNEPVLGARISVK
jgi:uncharacterized protein (TIGR03437 family)